MQQDLVKNIKELNETILKLKHVANYSKKEVLDYFEDYKIDNIPLVASECIVINLTWYHYDLKYQTRRQKESIVRELLFEINQDQNQNLIKTLCKTI